MLIKVCGMRESENIREVAVLGVDMIGFVFWPQSPRYVQMISAQAGIIPDYSEERLRRSQGEYGATADSKTQPKRVGVFVDDMPQNIVTRVFNYSLDYIQLHGDEPRETCENLRLTLDPDIRPGIKIIKTIRVSGVGDFKKCRAYRGAVDMFLFDIKRKAIDGSGEHFDWSVLRQYDGDIPFFLSGGIGPDDAGSVRALTHPMFAGIDLNSRFEVKPGVKDVMKLRRFIQEVREK
ncbi:N-(5'-phosphoribosyl)anthranilate isomerase [Prevotella sp. oral taxon 376]|uniref:phosphoribosylanthranilate isomerase n=1 Tax=Prevotella sp. oral taxon 376 TaxID=712466 RepID=UPI000D1F5896|nr:phosphoribosylanthranilate isomerase [Prevotella sp. oral taxon 376]PTL33044.1 N-(5'-phosphoribosyl)anthranilate isomerase [Prevotella sp. oral taxon 376]